MDYSEIEIFFSRASYCDIDILKLSVVVDFYADELHRNSGCHRQFQD